MNISSLHCFLTSIFVTWKLISWTDFWIALLFSFNLFSIFSSTLFKVCSRASLVAQTVKNPPAMRESWVQSLCQEDTLEEGIQPTPVFLPGESPCTAELDSPWGRKKSDTTNTYFNFYSSRVFSSCYYPLIFKSFFFFALIAPNSFFLFVLVSCIKKAFLINLVILDLLIFKSWPLKTDCV